MEISVVIPTYNRLEFLIEAYESVLQQDSDKYVLFIVDDSTNDETYNYFSKIKLDPKIFYFRNKKNLGIVENISYAFSMSKTKWVTMMSDDDMMDTNFVSESLKVLDNSSKAIVISSFRDIDENDNVLEVYMHKKVSFNNTEAFVELFYNNYPTAGVSGFFLNTELCKDILQLKNYPNALLSDSYLCLSAAKVGGMETIDKVIYSRRKWSGSLSSGGRSLYQKVKNIYVSHLAHRAFRGDLLELWSQLIKTNKGNNRLIGMKGDLDVYCSSSVLMNALQYQINKLKL